MRTSNYRLKAGCGAAVLAACACTAHAEGEVPDFHTAQRAWTSEIEPMVWFAAFRGDISFRDGSTVQVKDIGMDEVNAAPAGKFTLRADRWTFAFTGWATSIDGTATAGDDIDAGSFDVSRGDRVRYDFDYASFKLTAGYALDPFIRDDDNGTAVWFDLYGGAQVYYLDFKFGPADGSESVSEDGTWVAPLVGAKLNVSLPHGFEIALGIDAGATLGGGTGFALDIVPTFRWFPMENKSVAAEIGFRHNTADLSRGDDDFEFDGFAAGLFASVVIRF